ncbi:hypothetical protein MIMGU_mgv1a003426mg [Erythranthe guttata]|uniref:Trichome birefringence-like N-terminal domain-containing protein n=1 Tax=Erythranthe guttata TaxID=4155 RepID=A0A022QPP9_ERYGU|nr:PREDICTED: protein trichome birefringence-like 2 isoform X1 [Erythranthe guttata]EYU28435.1 hypothetical protein MIMGU_mgv1a003426mg [Erythranthe guttata]|eukprot:XP_012848061.1 PREDICTED: protein trichome birefringence-like 2 isoform X1 [Erythranthe guttata]
MVGFGFSSGLSAMDLKKLAFPDQILSSPRRKVVSPFGFGVLLSFIVFCAVLFNISSKGPLSNPVFQGLYSFGSRKNSSSISWPFSGVFNNSTANGGNETSTVNSLNETLLPNVAVSNKSLDLIESGEKGNVFEKAHLGNESKNGSFSKLNGSQPVKNPVLVSDSVNGTESGVNESKNGSFSKLNGSQPVKNPVLVIDSVNGTESVVGDSVNGDCSGREDSGGNSCLPKIESSGNGRSYKNCDIFNGKWVRDDSKPYYPPGSCPYIDRDFDCHSNGRPDTEFVKWRWQPFDCDMPRLNVTNFLEILRGKKLVFVGDSLNRNMWESLVCVLRHGVEDKNRVYEISGRHEFKKKGFYAFRFEDYNCSIDFVSSPFLVKESSFNGKNGSFETLRLDLMDGTTSMYHDADVIIFNTGHWWTHEKTSRGEGYYQEGNHVHPRLKVLEAYKRAIITWAKWVDKNIDSNKTEVIFRGYSVTHFRGGPWNSGGQCNKETEPIFNDTYLAKYPSKMRILEYVLKDMKTPVTYLNISRLTDYRKDGHPSVYRPDYQTAQQEVHAQDCSHWCLPGVPDTWNELLYVSLLKSVLGSLRN